MKPKPPKITQERLMALAWEHEPKASSSKPSYRRATCVVCKRPMNKMWHLWLRYQDKIGQQWVKEIHMCRKCAENYD